MEVLAVREKDHRREHTIGLELDRDVGQSIRQIRGSVIFNLQRGLAFFPVFVALKGAARGSPIQFRYIRRRRDGGNRL